jgi:anti-sigma B factor antagonist
VSAAEDPEVPLTGVGRRPFSCSRIDAAGAARLVLGGELDVATVSHLDDALRRAQADAPLVIVDLRELQFTDSGGAHLILAADRRARRAARRLVVVRGPADVERGFALMGIDRQLELVDQPEAVVPA